MATNTINQNVNTAITDFGLIKQAIVNKGVSVPTGTPTSQYGNKISSIQTGADVSGVTATAGDVDTGKVFVDSTGTEVTGQSTYKADYTALNTLVSGTTATQADVDSGKLFVKADGTQGTGSSTYKADYTALNTLVGQTTAVAEDVAQGKVFVNSSGVQTTGTASGGGEDLVKMIERPANSTITVPNGVTEIANRAFFYFENLISVTLPNTITTIHDRAFFNCTSLNSINLNEGITKINAYAFANAAFTSVTLPSTLDSIGEVDNIGDTVGGVFRDCLNLTNVTFLSKPSTFKESTSAKMFGSCTNLTTIRVSWGAGAVSGAPWGATNASVIYNYTP